MTSITSASSASAVLLAFSLAVTSAGPAAWQQAPSGPQFRSAVDILQLDVSVLDKHRVPVRDLGQTDFKVTIDGAPAEILAFTRADLPSSDASSAPWMREVAPDLLVNTGDEEGRLVVLLFDRSVSVDRTRLARQIGHATIDALGPSDLAAVVYVGRAVPQTFTGNRSLLRAAIDQPFLNTDEDDAVGRGECLCGTCRLEAIETVADALRDIPRRRKELFFVGSRITFQARSSTSPTQPDCWLHLKDARNKLFRALDRSNLTVHSLDPTGLAASQDTMRRLNLGVLPERTGGRVVLNTNAPERVVASIFAETQSYYVLGVERPSPRPNGRDREVHVSIGRQGMTVLSRRSYAAGSAVATPAANGGSQGTLVAALRHVLPTRTIPLALAVAPLALSASDHAALVVVSSVSQSAEDAESAIPESRVVETLAGSWDRNGEPVVTHAQDLLVPPGLRSARGPYELLSRLKLRPGRHDIRVAVRDRLTGRTGTVYGSIEIPDFRTAELSLSGLFLGADPAPPLAAKELFSDLLPIFPTATREFGSSAVVVAFVRAYQGEGSHLRHVTMSARLVGSSGSAVVADSRALPETEFQTTASADYLFRVPVHTLAPGPYLLTVAASTENRRVERHLRFQVR